MAIGQSQRKVDGGKIKGSLNVPSCIEVRMVWEQPNGKLATCVAHGRYATIPLDLQAPRDRKGRLEPLARGHRRRVGH